MVKNAKRDLTAADKPPGPRTLAAQLGGAHGAFRQLTSGRGGRVAEWRRYSPKTPWILKVTHDERALFYVTPGSKQFEVTVVLGGRATAAALGGRVRASLHGSIRSARAYAEGRPVRVTVTSEADLAGVEELVAVKLNPEAVG